MLRAHKVGRFIIIICGPGDSAHSRRCDVYRRLRLSTFGGFNDVNKCLFPEYSDMPYNASFKLTLRLKRRRNDRDYFNISPSVPHLTYFMATGRPIPQRTWGPFRATLLEKSQDRSYYKYGFHCTFDNIICTFEYVSPFFFYIQI